MELEGKSMSHDLEVNRVGGCRTQSWGEASVVDYKLEWDEENLTYHCSAVRAAQLGSVPALQGQCHPSIGTGLGQGGFLYLQSQHRACPSGKVTPPSTCSSSACTDAAEQRSITFLLRLQPNWFQAASEWQGPASTPQLRETFLKSICKLHPAKKSNSSVITNK